MLGLRWWSGSSCGAPGVTRTRGLLLRRQLLYPLSYGRCPSEKPAILHREPVGLALEPVGGESRGCNGAPQLAATERCLERATRFELATFSLEG